MLEFEITLKINGFKIKIFQIPLNPSFAFGNLDLELDLDCKLSEHFKGFKFFMDLSNPNP